MTGVVCNPKFLSLVLVAHNCNPAIWGLRHWDVRGLFAADPRLRPRISVRTMPRDAGPL